MDDSTGLVLPTTNVRALSPPYPHSGKPHNFQDSVGNRIARGMLPTVKFGTRASSAAGLSHVSDGVVAARLTVPSLRRRLSMKWNIILSTVVVALATCSQSFGFELLDRMLGSSGCGCQSSCCETNCCQRRHAKQENGQSKYSHRFGSGRWLSWTVTERAP